MLSARRFSNKTLDAWLMPPYPAEAQIDVQGFQLTPRWQVGIALMLNILSLALPIMMLQVYDRIIPHQAFGTLSMLIIGVLIALTLDAALRLIRAYLIGWTAASKEHAAAKTAFTRITRSELPVFEASSTGAHMQRFNALSRLREFSSGQALTALVDLPFAAVYLLLIAYIGGILVLVPAALLGLFFLFSHHAGDWLKAALEGRAQSDDRKASYVISVLTGIHTAKALSMESMLLRGFEERQQETTESSYRVAFASGFASTLSAAFGQLSLIATAAAGCLLVINGQLTVGGLSACTLLAGRALQPVQRVLGTWLRLQDFAVAKGHAEALLSVPVQRRAATSLPRAEGHLLLENVSFGYADGEPLLSHISLEAFPGDVIAIGGEKGSGKSTLLQLIAGLLTPNEGTASVDRIITCEHSMTELRGHVGYLPQQGAIFKGTILENITGFNASEEDIFAAKEAGKLLGLDAVVDLLPKGYATVLSDSNADPVPPGVKQRIALTRILKNQPRLLLFDDADRALDKEGYNRLFRLMGSLKGQCTLIMVSHDQNLLSFADRFYTLEGGMLRNTESTGAQHLSLLVNQKGGR